MGLGNYLASLCFRILICKIGIKIVNPPHRVIRLNGTHACKVLRAGPGTQPVLHKCELFSLLLTVVLKSTAIH